MTGQIRVLYIDDKYETVAPIVEHLSERFQVDFEEDFEAARKRLRKKPYDVIILDWEMINQKNGAEMLSEVRKENAHIKTIMVTAKLKRVPDLAQVVNLGLSKLYFKDDVELPEKLDEGIVKVVESRDVIIEGLEEWLSAREHLKQKIIHVSGDRGYAAADLLAELKKNSKIGKMQTRALVSYMFETLLNSSDRKKK